METPPCSEARRVGWVPDGACADPPPELDDRQGVFYALCSPAHHVSTPETTTPRLRCRGSPGQEVTSPTALDTSACVCDAHLLWCWLCLFSRQQGTIAARP
jgi:hypothetical protein